jgi:hypothetical protein
MCLGATRGEGNTEIENGNRSRCEVRPIQMQEQPKNTAPSRKSLWASPSSLRTRRNGWATKVGGLFADFAEEFGCG